ncbi:MAG: hypothetical protein AVDCRST_MAG93-7421 [uncultured Chloroflexia bacterium]|uniref:Uncharacterized protein n=1 Tax=uncultured Chloroflexia bacterium TaxID=1672391 RepID=A0A6J4MFW8_9CHLR|nr:MAG: hypothetical protein AVDCRST_MAG93-7421 [uncultured Chloroflexia bacterium]
MPVLWWYKRLDRRKCCCCQQHQQDELTNYARKQDEAMLARSKDNRLTFTEQFIKIAHRRTPLSTNDQ